MSAPLRLLFLCTGNSCRSQLAQGWTNALHKGRYEAFSAGVRPEREVSPLAVQVLAQEGIDISRERPKHPDALKNLKFDVVITLCDSAREACPVFPGAPRTLHAGFEDPLELARLSKTPEEALAHYRRISAQIKEFVLGLPQLLEK